METTTKREWQVRRTASGEIKVFIERNLGACFYLDDEEDARVLAAYLTALEAAAEALEECTQGHTVDCECSTALARLQELRG